MTLKEKFIPLTSKWDEENGWMDDESDAEDCIDVAEEFAIGFAIWCSKLKIDNWEKELLEIYKKEKGL